MLDEVEESVTLATEQTFEFLKLMAKSEYLQDPNLLASSKVELDIYSRNARVSRCKLRERMKAELNEI